MPPSKRPGSRPLSRQTSIINTSLNASDAASLYNDNFRKSGKFRKRPQVTDSQVTISTVQPVEGSQPEEPNLEEEVIKQLCFGLGDCSRQRLRAIQMGFRKIGNGETRISAKELYSLLQDNQVKLSSRTFQMVRELYEDASGINFDLMWRSLVAAQTKTGRDSVTAQHKRNDLDLDASQCLLTAEEKDEQLISRLAGQMARHREGFDLQELQLEFQIKDVDKAGKVERSEMTDIIFKCTMPVYGAVLHALLNRCDDEKSGHCSWPEMMSFLDRAKTQLFETGMMTTETWAQLKMRRLEEKHAAEVRAQEQRQRDLEAVAALTRGGEKKLESKKEKVKEQESENGTLADPMSKEIVKTVFKKLESLGDNMFHFIHDEAEHRSKRSAENILENLNHDPNVLFVEQQKILVREKRGAINHERHMVYDKQSELERPEIDQDLIIERYFGSSKKRQQNPCAGTEYEKGLMDFNDQYYCLQWYLKNNGQTKGIKGYDINVQDAWKRYTGRGVTITVLDDGLDHEHPEIKQNYDEKASYDLNDLEDRDHDPQPPTDSTTTAHGTRCAGEIAGVANNGVCGVGVAYNSNIGGVRLLDGSVTDKLEAQALSFKRDYIDIYSASWGPKDDGKTMEAPNTLTAKALEMGAKEGRGGKGNIYAWATGNGGAKDDCNADGYVSSIYTLPVGCINDEGLSTYFSEICTSIMAVVFTGGSNEPPGERGYDKPDISIITADVGTSPDGGAKCDIDFEGTSSAAPLAAGGFALVLEANPELTWRDMQHLVAETARLPNPFEGGWILNGAGYHVNHKFGFGSIDVSAMVALAGLWKEVNEQISCRINTNMPEFVIKGGDPVAQKFTVTKDMCGIERLEHTVVNVKIESTTHRGDMSVHIVSPSGTDSEVLSKRPNDNFRGKFEWNFMTVHNWNEKCVGVWKLVIQNQGPPYRFSTNRFVVKEWALELYGTNGKDPNDDLVRRNKSVRSFEKEADKACELPTSNLNEVMNQEKQEYEMLNKAVERGEPFSRETIEELADVILDKKDSDLLEEFIERELKRTNYEKEKSDNSVSSPERKYNPVHSQEHHGPENYRRNNGYPIEQELNDQNEQNKELYRDQKYLHQENRELKKETNKMTDDDLEETIELLREIIAELDE